MSLDQLIAEKDQKQKQNFSAKKRNNNSAPNHSKPKGNFGAAKRQSTSFSTDDRRSEPYVQRAVEVRQPLVYRPVKILNHDHQSSANTNVQQAPSSSVSVFARLGKPAQASGTYVSFGNLKRTVGGSDLQELCAAVGEVKDVEKALGADSAKVLFARRSDAVTCVAKFNGNCFQCNG